MSGQVDFAPGGGNNRMMMILLGILLVVIILAGIGYAIYYFAFRSDEEDSGLYGVGDGKGDEAGEGKGDEAGEGEAAEGEGGEGEGAGQGGEPVGMSYTVLENSDYPGNDIRQEKGKSVEELKGICNQEDTCLGFNSSGYLKSKLGNLISQKGVMFYKKDLPEEVQASASASASATNGVAASSATFTKMDNTDFPGNDIRNVSGKSIAELKNICGQEEDCKGFNSSGWLKKKTTLPITQQGVTFYKKNVVGASASSGASASVKLSPVSNFKVRSNTGIPMRMGNLSCEINQTLDSCAQKCLDDPRCKAINMERKDNGLCCLKSSVDGAIPNNNYDLYEKL